MAECLLRAASFRYGFAVSVLAVKLKKFGYFILPISLVMSIGDLKVLSGSLLIMSMTPAGASLFWALFIRFFFSDG